MNVTTEVTIPNLPVWMRQARRGVDWGVIIVIGLSLIASWSFIVYPTLPHTNASENYVYRAADYAQSIREGRFYPRWSPNALGGYGAPIPNFYAPGAPYIAALLDVLLTDDTVLAVRLVYVISLCVAGAVVYVFVTRRENATYGILAGTLYVFSPYVGLVAPHVLGNLPDVVSLALIPTLLWAVDRLILVNRPPDLLLIAFITAVLFLTSIPAALVGISLSLALLFWHRYTENRLTSIRLCLLAYLLGLGMAGFFWVPALLEQNTVNWQTKNLTLEPFNLTLNALLSPLNPIDTNELHNTPQITLGLIIALFTIVGGLSIFRHRAQRKFQAFFLLTGLIILLIGLTLLPAEIWLVGVAALCFSIAGSAALSFRDSLKVRTLRRLFLPSCIVLIWIGSNPLWLNPQTEDRFGLVTPETQIEYEQQGYGIAVLPQGFLLPSTLPFDLPPNRALVESYHTQNINKMAPGQISASFQASPLVHFTHSDHFQVRRVVASGPIDILTAYFPGWYATLSNQILPLSRTPDTGLIRLDVPTISTGNSELVLTLGPTDVRTGSWLIAGICLLIISIITIGRIRRQMSVIYEDMTLLPRSEARLLAITLGCFLIVALIFSNPAIPLSLHARPGYLLDGSVAINTRTDAGLSVYSFRLDNNQHQLNDTLNLTLYWQAQRFLPENYLTRLFLVNNRDGSVYAETDLRPPGYFPTRRWNTRQYVTDRYVIPLKDPLPAGNYQIHIELYSCNPDCASANRLNFFSSNGELLGTSLVLPTLIAIES